MCCFGFFFLQIALKIHLIEAAKVTVNTLASLDKRMGIKEHADTHKPHPQTPAGSMPILPPPPIHQFLTLWLHLVHVVLSCVIISPTTVGSIFIHL